jgi:hypothetical protein
MKSLKWVTVKKLAELTGYSDPAIKQKISRGQWPEGLLWRKSPDGRIHVNLEEYQKWVEGTFKTA